MAYRFEDKFSLAIPVALAHMITYDSSPIPMSMSEATAVSRRPLGLAGRLPLRARLGNTAEPSGELSVGDIVAVGEAGLAVARVGWTPVRGALHEVRTSEHGTHPLPPDARRGTGRLPSQEGHHDATRD